MKTYRIRGTNRLTRRVETANVKGKTPNQAIKLMGMTHYDMVVLDEQEVAL